MLLQFGKSYDMTLINLSAAKMMDYYKHEFIINIINSNEISIYDTNPNSSLGQQIVSVDFVQYKDNTVTFYADELGYLTFKMNREIGK